MSRARDPWWCLCACMLCSSHEVCSRGVRTSSTLVLVGTFRHHDERYMEVTGGASCCGENMVLSYVIIYIHILYERFQMPRCPNTPCLEGVCICLPPLLLPNAKCHICTPPVQGAARGRRRPCTS